jgi:dolichol-phosphate mannosyltransferase
MNQQTDKDQAGTNQGTRFSIVVPAYKEAENLTPLVTSITEAMAPLGRPYEVIVVDDNSQDGSEAVIAALAGRGHPVRLITRADQRGLSSAVIRGFREAKGEVLICMDADLSHPPQALPKLIERLGDGETEFVMGSRYVPGGSTEEGWGLLRWLNSKVATLLARPFTSVADPMAGFFALPRSVFQRAAALNPIGYKIGLELIVKCGCKNIHEVPIRFANRKFGRSKLGLREQLNYIKHLKRLADYKYGAFSELFQFCLVGATGTVVDLATYLLLLIFVIPRVGAALAAAMGGELAAKKLAGGLSLALGRALAIWVAMTWNFFFNRRLTFSHSRVGKILPQYWRFVVACSLGALANWSVGVSLPAWSVFFERHKLYAAAVGIVVGTAFNYLLSRYWVFRRLSHSIPQPVKSQEQ